MTETTKTFGVADILTHTTGRLLTPIGDVYLFLEWVTGEQGVMTHQLPRLSREVTPFLEKTFPDLAAIDIADVPISSGCRFYRSALSRLLSFLAGLVVREKR